MSDLRQISYFGNNELTSLFTDINNIIEPILPMRPTHYGRGVSTSSSTIRTFIHMMETLERLFFSDDLYKTATINHMMYRMNKYSFIRTVEETTDIPAFIFNESPKTRYDEEELQRVTNSELKRLEAAEKAFKEDKNHFLKIFTYKNSLYVYSNRPISPYNIFKLKRLQWTLFSNLIETEVPEIIDLLDRLVAQVPKSINIATEQLINLKMLNELKYSELKEVFKPDFKLRLNELSRRKEDKERTYIDYENRLTRLITELNKIEEEMTELQTKEQKVEDNSQLIEFLTKHPYIKEVRKTSPHSVALYYESPIIYFDDYIIKKLLPNERNPENKAILKAFLDNKYELITRCKIDFNTAEFTMNLAAHIGNSINIIAHPHIDSYGCFGSHRTALREAARTANYFGAIEQISQATLNINFTDHCVITSMLENLRCHTSMKTWRSKETGEMKTTKEIMEMYSCES